VIRAILLAVLLAFAAAAGAQQDRRAALDRAYDEVVAARAALEQAETAREKGVEPLAGERLGTAGGRSRLGDDYWRRQQQLDEGVRQARQRLDDALTRWRDVR
jgi:hypothetical protein